MEEWIITTAVTVGIGIISYFLKRTMTMVDRHSMELQQLRQDTASRRDLKEQTGELKEDIRSIREDYTPMHTHQKDLDECRRDLKEIRMNYLTKDDFIREINKMDRKLDQMLNMQLKYFKEG